MWPPSPVTLQQVLGEAAGGQPLRPGLRGIIRLVVLEVLNDVPHVAWLDWKQRHKGGHSVFCLGTAPQDPRSRLAPKTEL